MLVLSRKSRESVVVGGSGTSRPLLTVTVLGITDGKVRLGFEGNRELPVHRQEVWERIRAESHADSPTAERVAPID